MCGATRRVHALLLAAVLLLSGCTGGSGSVDPADERPLVVATVAPLTDLVARVGEGAVRVQGLVPGGVDSHTFEPSPEHARLLRGARLLIANGLGLETPTLQLAQANLPPQARVVQLGDQALDPSEHRYDRSFPRESGLPNPHAWLDVTYAQRYVDVIARELTRVAGPAHAERLRANAKRLHDDLEALHRAISTAAATVPEAQRKLVTYHDSWAYFGPRYGFTVIAAVQPEGFTEPSAREVRQVIDQIRTEAVPAVFGSEVFPSDVLQAIAAETGARFVGDLADDALPGAAGEPQHSYLGMMRRNARIIVTALGGDAAALDALSAQQESA